VRILRVGRLVRIVRVIRLLRAIRATHKITSLLLKDKIKTGIASVLLSAFLLILFCAVGILICEQQDPEANIKTAGDAVWWSVTTITTVGYGDKYPVYRRGKNRGHDIDGCRHRPLRILSGLAASFFIGSRNKASFTRKAKILARLERLEEKIDRLKKGE